MTMMTMMIKKDTNTNTNTSDLCWVESGHPS